MLQIQDLPRTIVAALMLRNAHAILAELDHAGVNTSFDNGSRLQWHGVEVRAHLGAASLIDTREAHLSQIEVLGGQR